jgi:hypothetical protein
MILSAAGIAGLGGFVGGSVERLIYPTVSKPHRFFFRYFFKRAL